MPKIIYQEMKEGQQYPYPNHNINPKDKGADFCMQYAKAACYDWTFNIGKGVLSSNKGEYDLYRSYAMGNQPITQHKSTHGVDSDNNTQLTVDWTIRNVVSTYRDKVIAKVMAQDYGIVCTPLDMQAKSAADSYYNKIKAKLAVRAAMAAENPEALKDPMFDMGAGEPLDMEELEMRMNQGEQFNRAKDAEIAISVGFYENDYKSKRKTWIENSFDYGILGVREYLGDDNKAKFRVCDLNRCGTSVTSDGNFKDIVHAWEEIDVPFVDLAVLTDENNNALFTEEDLTEFASSIKGSKFGNPSHIGENTGFLKPYDKFKAKVIDIEFITYNTNVYRDRLDSKGNQRFYEDDFESKSENVKKKRIKYVYKCKWIVGTDKCYDYGMCYDQKRSTDIKKAAETNLSFIFYAYNFDKMKADGFIKRLKPFLDDYQNTILKIQNFKNRAVPSGWWIDFSALESVSMQKGGNTMTPMQLLQMFFDTGVLVGRSEDEGGQPRNQNWKPVIPIENSIANELAMFANDLLNTRMAIEAITGHNDVTMGQASSKTLVPGYETAQQSTHDSLFPLIFADEQITLRLAEAVLARMKQGVKKGDIFGYAHSINTNTLKFMQIDPAISLREHGIELQKKSSEGEKAWLMKMMMADIQNGFLDSADAVTLVNTKNVKQAQEEWAFKVSRAKKNLQAQKMQELQATNEGNAQAAQISQQTALQTLQMQQDFELEKESMRIQGELQKEQMRIDSQERIAGVQTAGKIHANSETAQAKITSTEIAGSHQQHKQMIANEKQSNSNNK